MDSLLGFIVLFAIGGIVAGLTTGLFGLGGGAVLVPLFLFLLPKIGASQDVVMNQAVSTSLAIIIPSALAASYRQYIRGYINLKLLKNWFLFVLFGIFAGALIFKNISPIILKIGFMVYMALCAIYMFFKKHPTNVVAHHTKGISKFSEFFGGVFVGGLSTLLGIGGGTFTVPFFIAYNYSFKIAIAISSVTGLFIGFFGSLFAIFSGLGQPGLASYSFGYINILSLIVIAPFSMVSALYGVKVGHYLHEKQLKTLYIIFLFIIVGYVYFDTYIK